MTLSLHPRKKINIAVLVSRKKVKNYFVIPEFLFKGRGAAGRAVQPVDGLLAAATGSENVRELHRH